MKDPLCSHPSWTSAADLAFLKGEFKERQVEAIALRECTSCGDVRLEVRAAHGIAHPLPLAKKRGEEIHEANQAFFRALRTWAKS